MQCNRTTTRQLMSALIGGIEPLVVALFAIEVR